MKRISSDESFPRNIILSIDSDENNYFNNYSIFQSGFRDALNIGLSAVDALKIAKDKLISTVDKRNDRDKLKNIILSLDSEQSNLKANLVSYRKFYNYAIVLGQSVDEAEDFAIDKLKNVISKRSSPTTVRKRDLSTYEKKAPLSNYIREGESFNKKVREDYKKSIIDKISLGTGEKDVEKLEELFKLFKSKNNKTKNDVISIKRVIDSYNSKKEPEAPKVYSKEELEHYNKIVKLLDANNVRNNIALFQKYLESMSPDLALKRLRLFLSAKKYMLERGIPIDQLSVRIFMKSGGDFELAEKQVKEREEEGKLGLDVSTLRLDKDDEPLINYNGAKISLGRLVSYIYSNETLRDKKYAYTSLQYYIYELGMNVDDAVNRINKNLRFREFRSSLANMFPEDPDTAESIFSGYYLDDDLSFDDALRMTKEELNPSN